jgi:predicted pyridoxine 5'-phosphate oxidase superfamily flavin-nucleotide-binding protein
MAKLTGEMKQLIETQQCFVATVNPDGTPNLGPKRSTRVLDDEHLMFTEVTGKQTWANVQAGSQLSIAVVDRDRMMGYRFAGTPEVVTAGPLFEAAIEAMKARGIMAPVKGVVIMKVDAIYNLGAPNAGQRIA